MKKNNILKWLEENANAKTAEFSASLVPGIKHKIYLVYEQRFAFVMMLKFFCNEKYIDEVLAILAQASPKIWDTKQGLAWAMAECFIKFPDKTKRSIALSKSSF